jgi:hypothetical protein
MVTDHQGSEYQGRMKRVRLLMSSASGQNEPSKHVRSGGSFCRKRPSDAFEQS